MTEAQFQKQVTDLATYQGWQWMHVEERQARGGSWSPPMKGPLGKGFPDLMLVRGHTLLFVELKSQRGHLSEAQANIISILQWVGLVFVWRPSDWAQITEVLANA